MSNQATLPDVDTALETVIQGIDKRAFFDCMRELGMPAPTSSEEAERLYQMSFKVAASEQDLVLNKEAAAQPGPYAFADAALDRFLGIKQASVSSAPGLDDVSIAGALELARDPQIFASALVVKAAQAAQAAAAQQAG
jgi:hypothetical protein